jgi:hypothetical protein
MPSNFLIAPIEEKFNEALFDMNISQWWGEKEPSGKVVHT